MNEQLKKLNELGIDLDLFYVVTIRKYGIFFQGDYTDKNFELCKQLIDINFDENNNWFSGSENGINIVLTLQ